MRGHQAAARAGRTVWDRGSEWAGQVTEGWAGRTVWDRGSEWAGQVQEGCLEVEACRHGGMTRKMGRHDQAWREAGQYSCG